MIAASLSFPHGHDEKSLGTKFRRRGNSVMICLGDSNQKNKSG